MIIFTGLFQRAIAQSGVCLNPWAITTEPRDKAFRLGEILGKKTKNSRELIEYLKTVDPIKLISKMNDAISEEVSVMYAFSRFKLVN